MAVSPPFTNAEVFMSFQRLLVASMLMISPLAFADDPPAKPAENPPKVQQPQPPAQPQARAQQPQRPLPLFGQGFGFQQRDAFSESLAALGDLALTPNFTITNEQ